MAKNINAHQMCTPQSFVIAIWRRVFISRSHLDPRNSRFWKNEVVTVYISKLELETREFTSGNFVWVVEVLLDQRDWFPCTFTKFQLSDMEFSSDTERQQLEEDIRQIDEALLHDNDGELYGSDLEGSRQSEGNSWQSNTDFVTDTVTVTLY